jgi:phospholipid/cholesterol/gamma-HCH transport system substrate-binding protein
MKATTSQKIRIGICTIFGFLILACGIFVLGARRNMFGTTFLIYGRFRNISGLQIGNSVRFGGINVGTITGINIENDSTIEVTMRLKERVHRFLKEGAMASIGTDGLMGDKLINISPGPGENKPIAGGGQVLTTNPTDFDKILKKISNVADNAETITSSLAGIAVQINSGKGSIGRLIYSDSLEKGLESTVKTTHETIKAANKGVEGFQENMTAIKHNFLVKGYYKKKEKKERKEERKEERQERKAQRRDANKNPQADSPAK